MITIKTEHEIELMRIAGGITKELLEMLSDSARPGVTTRHLNTLAYDFIVKHDAVPNFLGEDGFPATICTSIDEEVVHGYPSARVLEEGMLLKIDCGCAYKGYHSDAARTVPIGRVSEEKLRLAEVCKQSFFKGMEVLRDGVRLGDLGHAIQSYVESNGYSVVRSLVGHGIGTALHEDPNVPNFGIEGRGTRLSQNMVIAVEPMINIGVKDVIWTDDDRIVTRDRKASAHYENTVVIREDGVEILTL